jgi:hypothetical protein
MQQDLSASARDKTRQASVHKRLDYFNQLDSTFNEGAPYEFLPASMFVELAVLVFHKALQASLVPLGTLGSAFQGQQTP